MKCVPAVILLAVVLTLNRLAYMSKALSRYVAFLRAVNGGQVSQPAGSANFFVSQVM